jgi:hypothetical protein
MQPYPDGSVLTDFLEVKGWVKRIIFQQSEVCICELLNALWQFPVTVPEGR